MSNLQTVAQLLAQSRAAHQQGRGHAKQKKYPQARESFQLALDRRLAARAADPTYTDPSWAEDLTSLHSRKQLEQFLSMELAKPKDAPEPVGYDQPSRMKIGAAGLLAQVAKTDRELEAYFRQQIGEDANTHFQVDLTAPETAVIPPDQWRTTVKGTTPCFTCTHPEARHVNGQRCAESVFEGGEVQRCACLDYSPSQCRHTWVFDTGTQRQCAGCGEQQQLQPAVAIEDTDAYQQLQRERRARQ